MGIRAMGKAVSYHHTAAAKAAISRAQKARIRTDAECDKISRACKGRKAWNKGLRKAKP